MGAAGTDLYSVGSGCINCSSASLLMYDGFDPAYSPDGTQLAFTRTTGPGNMDPYS